jgi:transposase InsO family protein
VLDTIALDGNTNFTKTTKTSSSSPAAFSDIYKWHSTCISKRAFWPWNTLRRGGNASDRLLAFLPGAIAACAGRLSNLAWQQTDSRRPSLDAPIDEFDFIFHCSTLIQPRVFPQLANFVNWFGQFRTSKFAVVELVEKADMQAAAAFLEALVGAVPYRIHTVLTDNGIQFADLPKNSGGLTARWRGHPFDRICLRHGIGHRLTQPNHPWTNGQVERMNRTIKEATVKRFFYDTHEQLKAHLSHFIAAYNFAR